MLRVTTYLVRLLLRPVNHTESACARLGVQVNNIVLSLANSLSRQRQGQS